VISPKLYVPTLSCPAVRVVSQGDASKFVISWLAQPGSEGYRVYAGFDPFHIKSLISGPDPLASSITQFEFSLPPLPPTQIVYFWVGNIVGDTVTFLDEMGSYHLRTAQYDQFANDPFSDTSKMLMAPCDQLYFVEEMRRRAKAVLEDTGEEADLFIKQWTGLADPTTQDELGLDPNYQPMTRNDGTYGVGFYPGFFPATRIRIRFGGLPQSQLDYQVPGLRPLMDNQAWTLWDPLMHENDLIVRPSTGIRYVVKDLAYSNYRGAPMTQRLTLEVVNPTSPLQKVTDAGVREKWGMIDALGYARIGFNVMPPVDADATDYLLF
jgi:hypothetical protein